MHRYLIVVLFILTSCAASTSLPGGGEYVGAIPAQYAEVYFVLEDSNLLISLANKTTTAMRNLLVIVKQETAIGMQESQYPFRMLRMRDTVVMTIPLNSKTTGKITVDYYFQPALAALPIQEPESYEFLEDSVSFRIPPR